MARRGLIDLRYRPENMPDSSLDSLLVSPAEIVRNFVLRLPLIVVLSGLVSVGTYLSIRTFGGEIFESSALVLVRERPTALAVRGDEVRTIQTIAPPAYRDILMNDELLLEVFTAAKAKFPDLFGNVYFTRFRENYSVKVLTIQDTSVTQSYSPVLRLSIKAPSAEAAKFMADLWLERAINQYGRIYSVESARTIANVDARRAELSSKYEAAKLAEQSAYRELERLDSELKARSELLRGVPLRLPIERPTAVLEKLDEEIMSSKGLIAELADIRLDIAALSASPGNETQVQALRAREQRALEIIAENEKVIDDLSLGASKAKAAQVAALALADGYKWQMDALNAMGQLAGADSSKSAGSISLEDSSDLRVLARPTLPDFRVGPKRAIISAGAAFGSLFLLSLLFLFEPHLRRALARTA